MEIIDISIFLFNGNLYCPLGEAICSLLFKKRKICRINLFSIHNQDKALIKSEQASNKFQILQKIAGHILKFNSNNI